MNKKDTTVIAGLEGPVMKPETRLSLDPKFLCFLSLWTSKIRMQNKEGKARREVSEKERTIKEEMGEDRWRQRIRQGQEWDKHFALAQ